MTTLPELLSRDPLQGRFTPSALKTLRDSAKLAVRDNFEVVSSSHLGISLYMAQTNTEVILRQGDNLPDSDSALPDSRESASEPRQVRPAPLPYDPKPTPEYRDALQAALNACLELEHQFINNPLLWLGLIETQGPEAKRVLEALQVDVPAMRKTLVETLSQPVPQIILLGELENLRSA